MYVSVEEVVDFFVSVIDVMRKKQSSEDASRSHLTALYILKLHFTLSVP